MRSNTLKLFICPKQMVLPALKSNLRYYSYDSRIFNIQSSVSYISKDIDRLSDKLERSETRLSEKLEKSETRLIDKLERTEKHSDSKLNNMEERLQVMTTFKVVAGTAIIIFFNTISWMAVTENQRGINSKLDRLLK